MKIFKVTAYGDTLFIQAINLESARARLEHFMGVIPDRLLTWTEVDQLPEGEEFL